MTWLSIQPRLYSNTPRYFRSIAHELAARRSQAYELENQGKFSEAFELWLSIDQDVPGNQTSLLKRVHLAYIQGDHQRALQLVKDALQTDQKQSTLTYLGKLRLQEWLIDLEKPQAAILDQKSAPNLVSAIQSQPNLKQKISEQYPKHTTHKDRSSTPQFFKPKYQAYTKLLQQSLNRALWRRLAIKRYAYAFNTRALRALLSNKLWSPNLDLEEKWKLS